MHARLVRLLPEVDDREQSEDRKGHLRVRLTELPNRRIRRRRGASSWDPGLSCRLLSAKTAQVALPAASGESSGRPSGGWRGISSRASSQHQHELHRNKTTPPASTQEPLQAPLLHPKTTYQPIQKSTWAAAATLGAPAPTAPALPAPALAAYVDTRLTLCLLITYLTT